MSKKRDKKFDAEYWFYVIFALGILIFPFIFRSHEKQEPENYIELPSDDEIDSIEFWTPESNQNERTRH